MGVTLLGAPKLGRTYPNMNVMMAIRAMHRVGGPGIALPRGTPKGKLIPIGTIPAGSSVTSVEVWVKTAYGAGFTLDVGGNPNTASPPTFPVYGFGPNYDLSTTGRKVPPVPASTGFMTFGYVADDVEVYARLNGAADPATGELDIVIQFYTNKT